MKILVTGVTGYIGKRLVSVLLEKGYELVCCVRKIARVTNDSLFQHPNIQLLEIDFLDSETKIIELSKTLSSLDAAYYLIHSLNENDVNFEDLEQKSAHNFLHLIQYSNLKQIIYLGGIINETELSKHLSSRKKVEEILRKSPFNVTALRAGIVVGSGSASFEIIRDLVEKLPVMITPKWLNTKTQPIAVRNVLDFLSGVLLKESTYNQSFDISGNEILTYKQMLLIFAKVRNLKRTIITIPVMTPKLSSYWLYFVTSTSYHLAVRLVNSMKIEIIAKKNNLAQELNIELISYEQAVRLAFEKIEQNYIYSSWKDSWISSNFYYHHLGDFIQTPTNGCFIDYRSYQITGNTNQVIENIWSIGGERGWYYANFLWKVRGFLDKIFGGVGLRRGRTNENTINQGDVIDFWRVLYENKQEKRLLLYAEMKLPGEAWLEYKIKKEDNKEYLHQTATFRPIGLLGRLYWFSVLPFHHFIFNGMLKNIVTFRNIINRT